MTPPLPAAGPACAVVASGGLDRSVLLWQPKGNVGTRVGELAGHSAAVCRVEVRCGRGAWGPGGEAWELPLPR